MKFAIISDLHDNLVNAAKCLSWCAANGVGGLICCGDVTNKDSIEFLATKFSAAIYLVRGNVCNYDEKILKNYPNIIYLGRDGGTVELGGKKIGICHEPFLIDELIKEELPEIIFYGHTHKPWDEMKSGVRLINSGTLGGIFQKATFAIYDTTSNELDLKIMDTITNHSANA